MMKDYQRFKEQGEFCQSYFNHIGIQELEKQYLPLEDIKECKEIEKSIELMIVNEAKSDLEKQGFEIIKYIAQGAQGRVFLGRHRESKVRYAFKCIAIDNTEAIQSEIKTLQLFKDSPFVINYVNHFKGDKFMCIQMQECKGTLEELLVQNSQKTTNMNENTFIKLATEIFFGLMDLHSKDIIICDLKPENILIDYKGRAIISDFGLAKQLKQDKNSTIQEQGNLVFRAPEGIIHNIGKYEVLGIQVGQDKLSKKADLFSFGLILYRMIAQEEQLTNRFGKQSTDIDAYPFLLSFKHKDKLCQLIKRLTCFNPKERLGHLEAFSMLYSLYNQEISIDNYKLNSENIQLKVLPTEVKDLICSNQNYIFPIYTKYNQKKTQQVLTAFNQFSSEQLLLSSTTAGKIISQNTNYNQLNPDENLSIRKQINSSNNLSILSQIPLLSSVHSLDENYPSPNLCLPILEQSQLQSNISSLNAYTNKNRNQNNLTVMDKQQTKDNQGQGVLTAHNQIQNEGISQQANKTNRIQLNITRTFDYFKNMLNKENYKLNQNITELYNLVEGSSQDLKRLEDIGRRIFKNDLELDFSFSLQSYESLHNEQIEFKSKGINTQNYIIYFNPPQVLIRANSKSLFSSFSRINTAIVQRDKLKGGTSTYNNTTFEIALAFVELIFRLVYKTKLN